MIAVPYYLLSLGIMILLIGFLLAGLRPPASDQNLIDPDMEDDEIIEKLQSQQQLSLPSLVIIVGFLCISVGLVWRMLR